MSAVTTLTTPWLIQASGPVAAYADRKAPASLQTALALYGSWLERLRTPSGRDTAWARARRFVRALLVDAGLLCGVVIGTSIGGARAAAALRDALGLSAPLARWVSPPRSSS